MAPTPVAASSSLAAAFAVLAAATPLFGQITASDKDIPEGTLLSESNKSLARRWLAFTGQLKNSG